MNGRKMEGVHQYHYNFTAHNEKDKKKIATYSWRGEKGSDDLKGLIWREIRYR